MYYGAHERVKLTGLSPRVSTGQELWVETTGRCLEAAAGHLGGQRQADCLEDVPKIHILFHQVIAEISGTVVSHLR